LGSSAFFASGLLGVRHFYNVLKATLIISSQPLNQITEIKIDANTKLIQHKSTPERPDL
jgi:hypothetical protein